MTHKNGLLTKCEVKMAGYWPSFVFASLWTETESRSINSQKRMRPISSQLYRTNLVTKGFIIWLSSRQDSSMFPARVANQSTEVDSSCVLVELGV